ncbi:hypothetical protein P7C73_g1902, partial [Tremellales sp. Uapishka_1]
MGYTLLIDNYDSFTWNIYADLAVLGGNPLVRRNDKISIEDIEAMFNAGDLDRIVISPGPGHPRDDSGISREAITWGTGKLPILGVCMGLECLVDVMGGEIAFAGEVKHGKTSQVSHDNLGIFHDLPPLLASTRYHSLSASLLTLPPLLQVTATTAESGVIMAVRHRTACVEAVQYHPESCMSEGGRGLMANFLKMKGGSWGGENAWCGVPIPGEEESGSSSLNGVAPVPVKGANGAPTLPTILNKIQQQRLQDVSAASITPATTPANLSKSLALHASPPLISFYDRVVSTPHTAIMAEIKRASPSKSDIAPTASAPAQALRYALAGASVISVLTEPTWFKGSLTDLMAVRMALDSLPNRPAILRKDFILSPYQIDEARLSGADTVLLIVAMYEPVILKELYDYSVSLGMEPLVEVNNVDELSMALDIGAKVIGVNNRNLHDFTTDMSTTSRVNDALKGRKDVVLCSLSGISTPADVERYAKDGVKAVLVGESLMRAENTGEFMRSLIGLPAAQPLPPLKPLVKICGVRSLADAKLAIEAGADLIGIILVPSAKRFIASDVAQSILSHIRAVRSSKPFVPTPSSTSSLPWFTHHAQRLAATRKPLLVGVFQNQPLAHILDTIEELSLDLVQLHGDEPQSWAKFIPVPVIKAFRVAADGHVSGGEITRPGLNQFVLLDAAPAEGSGGGGGEGKSFPWEHAQTLIQAGEVGSEGAYPLPVILAGGLGPLNVAEALEQAGGLLAVDVSSGVEGENGKDQQKVESFIKAVKVA